MSKAKKILEHNLFKDGLKYFGHKDKNLSIEIANIWHDDIIKDGKKQKSLVTILAKY